MNMDETLMAKDICVFRGSAGVLPALPGILPGSNRSATMSLRLRRAPKPAGNMPAGASKMLALPEQRAKGRE
jgi:hypothetical protein